jgi:hypothetical protein
MNGDVLGIEMMKAVDALSNAQKQDREAIYKAMGRALVAHIQRFGFITGAATGLTSPPGGGPVVGVIVTPPGSIK